MSDSREYKIKGIRVETRAPAKSAGKPRPPILFVHGGCHGSWSWEKFLPYFADAGWECHALNWYGHNGSDPHPKNDLIHRSIADVVEEISLVAGQFEAKPILIGHSMGALASQKFAEQNSLAGLVLSTSVVPSEVGGAKIDVPVDFSRPWGPPPFELAMQLFFQGLTEDEARPYYERLCPESPKAAYEATRWSVSVDKTRVSGPILVLGAELDVLTPPSTSRALADFYGADYRYLRGRGHNLLLEPGWQETAGLIAQWLERSVV
ncbi:alpha/beta hydrolase [Bradyrhizobium sp. TM239]|uniref:alpha/beta hydrolase n=1 Tax=Bradyrhizobium sp. TM239 TaxID=2599802 RepID=UPI0027D52503|nr:alpha/beta hydrolase [Bradyrhizobium sp. TM239]